MIISGGSRSNWRFFSKHLMRTDENEHVRIAEIRGLAAENVLEAFREMDALASGTRCKNFFYHANINPRAEETLTEAQWDQAIDTLESNLGLEGHSRFVVEHEKDGRVHRHVVWSRIDVDSMTAVSDSRNYATHERTSRELEATFGHEPVQGALERDGKRPERRPENWETFRGHQSGLDPQAMKEEITDLWQRSDTGQAFAAALAERGYVLAKGDRRDFCIVDAAGDAHSLARRIEGAKAKDIRARMEDVDRDALPTVAQARAMIDAREDSAPPVIESRKEDARTSQQPSTFEEAQQRLAQQPTSAFDRFADDVKQTMRSNDGDMHMHDGLSWLERTATVIGHAVSEAITWVKDHWQDLVERFTTSRNSDREPGMER